MKIKTVTIQDIRSLPAVARNDVNYIFIFDELGTDGCLLDCQAWKIKQSIANRHTTNQGEKRGKWSENKGFAKASIHHQRQHLQNDLRITNKKLKAKRESFELENLEDSSKNGCGSCQFIEQLLKALLPVCPSLVLAGLKLEWSGYGFLLNAQNRQGQMFSFQLFTPTGE